MIDAAWDSLLRRMRKGEVVPVLGSQLLAGEGGADSLTVRVAERLLASHGLAPDPIPTAPGRELNEAIGRIQRDGRMRLQDLYESVYLAIDEVTRDDAVIPLAIRQLAEIDDFRMMVTVTPDDMLVRCLRRRCAVNEIIHAPGKSSPGRLNDLPEDWTQRHGELQLLYLFGKADLAPVFAIHDEDVLEYAHNVVARGSNVPLAFLGELQCRNLLFIGCRFPDWLSRFFLRATNKDRLSGARSKREWMIERLEPEESLTLFLSSYSKDTEILSPMEPSDFVAELHRRWSATRQSSLGIAAASVEPAAPQPGAMFFVSYSRRTDLVRAESLTQALRDLGASAQEVWFDRKDIEPGHDFQQRIFSSIGSCRYFVPLLSDSAQDRGEAFVFREWREATQRLQGMGREFLVPLIVDADYEPERYVQRADVPDWPVSRWSGLDFGHAPEGKPDARTLSRLKALLRQGRSSAGGG